MSSPDDGHGVSVVIPALGLSQEASSLLGECLTALDRAMPGNDRDWILVDDSGEGGRSTPARTQETQSTETRTKGVPELGGAFAFGPGPRILTTPRNLGFAGALEFGLERARHARVLALNSDVLVDPDFLAPLVEALERRDVFAVVPRVELFGDSGRIESLVRLVREDGRLRVRHEGLGVRDSATVSALLGVRPVPFPVGGAFLFRREVYDALGGFDPVFAPFYLEDLDLGWRAWAAGHRVLHVPASRVAHHHRGTIGRRCSEDEVRAVIERNRWIFEWKHLDARGLRESLACARATVTAARVMGRREELEWLLMALEQASSVLDRRDEAQASRFAEFLAASDPFLHGNQLD